MNIVYCFNDNDKDKEQIMLLHTSIISLLINNPDVKIYIIYSYFNKINLTEFKTFFKDYHCISLIPFDTWFDSKINYMLQRSIPANKWTFLRLFIGEILPNNIDKILYLDTDTVINWNLNKLFTNHFNNKSIQVVLDNNQWFSKEKETQLNLWNNTYFNAWIIYFNLRKIRNDLLSKSIQTFSKYDNLFADQDCLNIIFNNDIKIIKNSYNYIVDNKFSSNEKIYHFATRWKILKINPVNIDKWYQKIFWVYFDQTIYKGFRPNFEISNLITFIIYKLTPAILLRFLNKFTFYKKMMHVISNYLLKINK